MSDKQQSQMLRHPTTTTEQSQALLFEGVMQQQQQHGDSLIISQPQRQQQQQLPPSPRFVASRKQHSRQSSTSSDYGGGGVGGGGYGGFMPLTRTLSTASATSATTGTSRSAGATTTTTATTFPSRVLRPSSPSGTGSDISSQDETLPTNVSTIEQLEQLPVECLSDIDPSRPIQHVNEDGTVSTYSLHPMTYSVIFILVVELLERFAFYGINYTQTSYLTGEYNEEWNAGMESVPASSYVSISIAVAYTTPFLGAYFADTLFGDYYSILVGSICFYLPGLFLIAFTTVPKLLGDQFNQTALATGLLLLWPVGTGIVKSVVNVFGAKQFHPLLQSSMIEAYYVNFYMCINVGALIGGIVVPVLAQSNVTMAYFLPVTILSIGIVVFVVGSSRYVISKPNVDLSSILYDTFDYFYHPKKKQVQKKQQTLHKMLPSSQSNIRGAGGGGGSDDIPLSSIARVSLLIVPFSIAYSQMATTFIIQGNVMEKAFGWIDAATMNNADAVAVLIFGYVIGSFFYPWLNGRNIKIPTTYKFAIGSGLGALSIAWALQVDSMIHTQYVHDGTKVSILWQTLSYVLIGIGEIFAVSAAYEVAFTASPPENKVLSSAVNLFCIGGLPNVICIVLYQLCSPWFVSTKTNTANISHISDYASAHVDRYFWLLLYISIFGVVLNVLPPVREYVETIEERATEMIRTPKTPSRPPWLRRGEAPIDIDDEQDGDDDGNVIDPEKQKLLLQKSKRHQYYLKYGSGPSLYKSGSMRAGPSMKRIKNRNPSASSLQLKKNTIAKLYKSEMVLPSTRRNTLTSTTITKLYNSESADGNATGTSTATLLSTTTPTTTTSAAPSASSSSSSNRNVTPTTAILLTASGKPVRLASTKLTLSPKVTKFRSTREEDTVL